MVHRKKTKCRSPNFSFRRRSLHSVVDLLPLVIEPQSHCGDEVLRREKTDNHTSPEYRGTKFLPKYGSALSWQPSGELLARHDRTAIPASAVPAQAQIALLVGNSVRLLCIVAGGPRDVKRIDRRCEVVGVAKERASAAE